MLEDLHHTALICSHYETSRDFYTRILGMDIVQEVYRAERASYKLDLALNGRYLIELFSFPDPPARASRPEACGLRHLAFAVRDIEAEIRRLAALGVSCEAIRTDPHTGQRFTFFEDPDRLPLELYEISK